MQKVWITERLAVGHCTASHCIGLYKEITSMWPKSEFALIYKDGVGGKYDGHRAREGLQEEKGSAAPPSVVSALLLPDIKVLFFSFCLIFFTLIVALAVAFVGALRLHSTESLCKCVGMPLCMCMYACMYACIAANYSIWYAANCCALLVFYRFRKWTKFHAMVAMETDVYVYKMGFFFLSFKELSSLCVIRTVAAKLSQKACKCVSHTWVCIRCVCLWE